MSSKTRSKHDTFEQIRVKIGSQQWTTISLDTYVYELALVLFDGNREETREWIAGFVRYLAARQPRRSRTRAVTALIAKNAADALRKG